jgi:protease IV
MATLRRVLVAFLAVIGFLTLAAVAGGAVLAWRLLPDRQPLPGRILLTADWRDGLAETVGPPDLLDLELIPPPTVAEVVLALDAAARDPRVAGLVVRLAETAHGFAVAQELRDAVRRFRAAGKFAVAHADTFGELGSGNEGYYIASAFEEIDLQPVGLVGLTGLLAQVPLARDLLARLGISFEVVRRAEYKTALESLTESELSAPNREMLEALLGTLQGQLVAGVAEGRGMPPERVRRLVDRGPLTGPEALAEDLVDRLGYAEEALDAALGRAGAGAEPVDLADYANRNLGTSAPESALPVALIRAAGLIRRGEDGIGSEIAADDLAGALAEAAEDDELRAVVLRVDSGGGSAVASETIGHAVQRVRQAGKPVVVSMGNTAASGGYWIAMNATRIVAQPGTLTGSIGVIAGKPSLAEAWNRLGVNWAEIRRGANAAIFSLNRPFSPEAEARVEAIVGSLYESFTEGVAQGRGMRPEQVEAVAKGRVWAGETALGLGLVDELGGLDAALAATRAALQLPADAPLRVELVPRDASPVRAVLRWLRPGADDLAGALAAGLLRLLGGAHTALSLPVSVR